ncbi:hypothetical protein TcG_08813 [Trypanosoma cruzi]|nr:hypothetical protein TcG_08813 [Trypanosoma cruzi]
MKMWDCAETRELEVHVAFSELRCCVKDEDARAVRQADGSVCALLREHLLQEGALHRWCDEAVRAAQADGGAGGADGALWRVTHLRGTRVHRQPRRHVVHCLQLWVPANSGRRSAKDFFMAAMG